MTDWEAEAADILARFTAELSKATADGSRKRQSGDKVPWWEDKGHIAAFYRHLQVWEKADMEGRPTPMDRQSGAHPLVHSAWRLLSIACQETGNVPDGEPKP